MQCTNTPSLSRSRAKCEWALSPSPCQVRLLELPVNIVERLAAVLSVLNIVEMTGPLE